MRVTPKAIATAIVTMVLMSSLGVQPASAVGGQCAEIGSILGECPNIGGELGDDEAVLSGDLNGSGGGSDGSSGGSAGGNSGGSSSGGSDGSTGGSSGSGSTGGAGGGGAEGGTGEPGGDQQYYNDPCVNVFVGYCERVRPDAPPVEPDPVTLSDIAAFRPTPPVQYMQPDGWMVVGLPTNFYADTAAHVVSGELFDLPAEVRFTPVTYRWRYGDATRAVLGTKGATWAALGLREFDATPTSHIYRASGTYVIDLDVDYTAHYRILGGTWWRIPGVLQLPANRLVATAGDAVTVLVDRDCATAPSGPGC